MSQNNMFEVIVDKEKSIQLGINRQSAHLHNSSPRFFDDKNEEDVIGISGELAFSSIFKMDIDERLLEYGDNGIDFSKTINGKNISIDVKTARKPIHLLVKEKEINRCADILVLAKFDNFMIKLIGWETKQIMSLMPVRNFGYNILNYYRHYSELRPMQQLLNILGR